MNFVPALTGSSGPMRKHPLVTVEMQREVLRRMLCDDVIPPWMEFHSALWGACTVLILLREAAEDSPDWLRSLTTEGQQ